MAVTHLKNAGVFDASPLDPEKTTVTRLASQQLGRDRFRQLHLVRMHSKAPQPITAITAGEVSSQECSVSGVDVYRVAETLGDYSKPGR